MAKNSLGRYKAEISADTRKFRKELGGAETASSKFRKSASAMSSAVAAIDGPFGGISSRISAVTSLVSKSGVAVGVFAGALSALGAVTVSTLRHMGELEVGMAKTEAILKATGSASGLTAQQLDTMARSVALSTLASTEGVRNAQNALLTFKSITGPVFESTIRLSQDMAAVFGGDIKSSAVQLGKALEDPINGLTALRRVGVSFTDQQKEQIKKMVEVGEKAKAQKLILAELQKQVGGAGQAEAGGLSGAVDTLSQRWDELLEAWDRTSGTSKKATEGINRLARGLKVVTDSMNEGDKATDLFEKRLHRVIELQALQEQGAPDLPARKVAYHQRIANLQQEITLLDKRLGIVTETERKEAERVVKADSASKAAIKKQEQELAKIKAEEKAKADKEAAEAQTKERLRLELVESQKLSSAVSRDIDSLKTPAEREQSEHQARMERLRAFGRENTELKGYINQQIEREEKRHKAAMEEIEEESNKARLNVAKGIFGNLSVLMNSENKKLFKIGKIAAIASATVAGAESIVHSYNAGSEIGGPPLGAIFAATAAAATAVQIQNIKAQRFGGGGTVTAGTSGGAGPGVYQPPQPAIPASAIDPQAQGNSVQVHFHGNVGNIDNAEKLAELIADYIETSDSIIISDTSRNGQLLRAG